MLDVVIVGAGIAGLAAGISLRRAGHKVHIYEKSAMNNEVGAAIHVPPNVSRFLVPWGLDPAGADFVKAGPIEFKDPKTMKTTMALSHAHNHELYGADLWYAHRVDLHDALKQKAIEPMGPGIPVVIHLKSAVVGYKPDLPSVLFDDGSEVKADLVIGADGVHSIASETVLGRKNPPSPASHYNCCYRFLIPKDVLEKDEQTRFFNENADNLIRLYPDNEKSRRLVSYPCRKNTIHNFVGLFYDEEMKSVAKEDYHADFDKSLAIQRFDGFHPSLQAVIGKATEIKRWPLLYRAPLPTWTKGKLVLAGDSAHPMLPHQGQGGAMGIEDGAALGIIFTNVTNPSQVPERLALYEKLRRNRASAIQILSNVGLDQAHLVRNELMEFLEEKHIPKDHRAIMSFNMSYDIISEAVKLMEDSDASFLLPTHFFDDASVKLKINSDVSRVNGASCDTQTYVDTEVIAAA
ncbi:FAD binding domain-containing protein [Colletotrichum karsti]|uniref:FAD binding domain-containing protein n=1 Tax=Colletotrichum karsti TaxID=1095194 RepID=A0A9P6HVH9_9PEZI|nr:FAD binding domain-containing protein [Colletotrichum karsti]KAF9872153.1 FAD binding domain-containing protein [Colletotrichum karsti]